MLPTFKCAGLILIRSSIGIGTDVEPGSSKIKNDLQYIKQIEQFTQIGKKQNNEKIAK